MRIILALFVALALVFPNVAYAQISVMHLATPQVVKALYINLGTVGAPRMQQILGMVGRTELNAFVIDIRSNGGPIMFASDQQAQNFLTALHQKNIYLIARIVAFKCGDKCWYDPSNRARWEQIASVSRRAIDLGFDEINYDYVRYGSVNEPSSTTPVSQRAPTIRAFFQFLKREVRDKTKQPISVDIFGWAFIAPQSAIGQRVEDAAENFDYVMPMVYPSHWGRNNLNIPIPGREPYKTVYRALTQGWNNIKNDPKRIAQLRVWVQAFDLESINPIRTMRYGPAEIRAQIQACYDTACVGWTLWNAGNIYNEAAFLKK